MLGFLIFGVVLSCAQSYHHHTQYAAPQHTQQTYVAQQTWNAQPQQYTAQNSASLHQRRLNDPNWAVNSPIQAWEAAYNGPAPVPAYSQPQQTYRQPQQTYRQPQATYQQSRTNHAAHMQRHSDPLWAVKGGKTAPSGTFTYQYTSGTPQASWQQNSVAYKPSAHVPAGHTARHSDPLWAVKKQGGHYRYKRSTQQDNVLWAVPNPDTAGINNVHWAAPNPTTAGINNVNWAAPNPTTAGINNVNWAAPNPETAGTLNVNWAAPAGNNNPLWALG